MAKCVVDRAGRAHRVSDGEAQEIVDEALRG